MLNTGTASTNSKSEFIYTYKQLHTIMCKVCLHQWQKKMNWCCSQFSSYVSHIDTMMMWQSLEFQLPFLKETTTKTVIKCGKISLLQMLQFLSIPTTNQFQFNWNMRLTKRQNHLFNYKNNRLIFNIIKIINASSVWSEPWKSSPRF